MRSSLSSFLARLATWPSSLSCEDELDLHCRIERKRVRTNGGADVTPIFAEQLNQELAGAIGNGWLLGEARVAADERADARNACDLVDTIGQRAHRRQRVQHALFGRRLGGV